MSHKTTRTTTSIKQVIPRVSQVEIPESVAIARPETLSNCGLLDIEELAKKEGDLHKLIETDIAELFESLDTYGNGYLTNLDITSAFRTFDIEITEADAQAILDAFDSSGEGHITFGEFQKEMHDIMMGGTLEEHLKLVFQAIDVDNDGYFTFNEVMRQFQKLGAKCDPDEAKEAFKEISGGGDKVDYELFKAYCEHLDRAQKIAETPITTIAKDEAKTSRKLNLLQRKNSMASSFASQTFQSMKTDLDRIEGSPYSDDDSNHGGGGRGMGNGGPAAAAPKRPMMMGLFAAAMMN